MRGSLLMRVMTIRQRAWFAWRLPPGLSRWRPSVLPDPAGIGRDAAEVGEGGFGADAFGVVAGGDEQGGGGVDADAVKLEQARCGGGDELGEEGVELADVLVEVQDPAAEGAQRELGCMQHRVAARVGPQPGGAPWAGPCGTRAEPFSQLIGAGEAEVADLVEAADPGLAG